MFWQYVFEVEEPVEPIIVAVEHVVEAMSVVFESLVAKPRIPANVDIEALDAADAEADLLLQAADQLMASNERPLAESPVMFPGEPEAPKATLNMDPMTTVTWLPSDDDVDASRMERRLSVRQLYGRVIELLRPGDDATGTEKRVRDGLHKMLEKNEESDDKTKLCCIKILHAARVWWAGENGMPITRKAFERNFNRAAAEDQVNRYSELYELWGFFKRACE
jgi:hypothetical protein